MNPNLQAEKAVAATSTEELSLDKLIDGSVASTVPENARSEVVHQVKTLAEYVLSKSTAVDTSNLSGTIAEYIAEIDRKLSEQINQIIHDKKFQKLEGSWRGLHHLVNRTETDTLLKIKVLNISKDEVAATLKKYSGVKWDQSPIFKKVYQEGYGVFGGDPVGALIGDYEFDHSPKDVAVLTGLSQVCAAAHAPFFAAAAPSLVGLETWDELNTPPDIGKIFDDKKYLAWNALRESEDARYVGLTMPRFVTRLPYGQKGTNVSEFSFEEDTAGAHSSKFVWSNAAYAMGANITSAFKKHGWTVNIRGRMSGGLVEDLPCHSFTTSDGTTDVKCPTEVSITDTREFELSKQGLIPLTYIKNTNQAVFVSAQSLQKPKAYVGADADSANRSAQLSARLPYVFASSRFAHYLKCMVRDRIGKPMERAELEGFLQNWINNYVLPNPEDANDELKAKKPLAGAQVEVKEIEGQPGFYNAVFRLRPHFQLEGVNVSMRLVGKLKQGA